jgi:hypothetical protein
VNSDPRDVIDGFLLYSPRTERYVIDRRQIIKLIRGRLHPETEHFQERLDQFVEIASVGSVRSRMYHEARGRVRLWNFTDALGDERVPVLAKTRLGASKEIRTLHRDIALKQMRGFSSPAALSFQLDRYITMILAQEACIAQRGDGYVLSLIQR